MEAHKPRIPRLVPGVALHALPLGPLEGFVLSRIDGSASVGDIADLTSLDTEQVVEIIAKLISLSAVEWADGAVLLPRATDKNVPPKPVPPRASQAPPPKNVTEVPAARGAADASAQRAAVRLFGAAPSRAPLPDLGTQAPAAVQTGTGAVPRPQTEGQHNVFVEHPTVEDRLEPVGDADAEKASETEAPKTPDDGIDMPLDRRKRIDDLYVAIDLLDHYEVLGITRKADKAKVRSAYFELSKAFHPDTVFRKSVGNYRSKMESIFKRLTEAYEVLGKKKAREEYDAYLESIGATRDAEEALSGENEIPAELRTPEASSPATSSAPILPPPSPSVPATPSPPPAPLPPRSAPTESGKRVARELIQKRLANARSTAQGGPTPAAAPEPPPAPVERSQKEVLRDLAGSLRSAAAHTGGVDQVTRLMGEARRAEAQGDLTNAVRSYRLAMACAPDRADIAADHARVAKILAVSMATQYEQQARYEESHRKWGAAATSWAKVIEGRPDDVEAHVRGALALLEAKGDLKQARSLAQRAVTLAPEDPLTHQALGRVFLSAGLLLNAKRELEAAKQLDPKNPLTQMLIAELAKAAPGQ